MNRGRVFFLCTGVAALIGVGAAKSLADGNRQAPTASGETKYGAASTAPRSIRQATTGGSIAIAKQLPEGPQLSQAILSMDVPGQSGDDEPSPHGPGSIVTGFETPFVVGPIEPQQGWAATGTNLPFASISTANPSPGSQHLRIIANPAAAAGTQHLVFSPALAAQPNGPSVFSVRVNISNDLGADYDVAGQAPSLSLLTWRVKFRFNNSVASGTATPPGTIFVLDDLDGAGPGAAAFQNTNVPWLEGVYATLRVEFNPTGTTNYFYNGALIYSDTNGAAPFGTRVEQIVFIDDNFQNAGETADFDQMNLTPTTTTGACCNLVSGCTANVLHSACSGATSIFFPNQTCAQITCNVQGACCLPSGLCTLATAAGCTTQSGIFRGTGTVCGAATCDGACCTAGPICTVTSASACETAQGVFRGPDTQCPPGGPACPAVCTFSGPNCHDRNNADAINGTAGIFNLAEDFILPAGQNVVNGLCWFDAYIGAGGSNLPVAGQFSVTYRSSVNGLPGPVIPGGGPFLQGAGLTVGGAAPTGDVIAGTTAPIFSHQASHANVTIPPNTCVWVEISNDLPDGSAWFWVTSGAGNNYFVQDGTPPNGYDASDIDLTANLSLCLNQVLGDDLVCAAGACCISGCYVTCQDGKTQSQCDALGGSWSGAGTNCIENCQPSAPCCRGDLQPDGNYNGRDIQLFAKAIVGGVVCDNDYPLFCAANVNEDAVLSALDVPGFITIILNGGETIDRCCGARLLTCNSTTVIDNTTATTSANDPEFPCHFGGTSRGVGTVWLKFVATDTTAQIDTLGSTGTANDSLLAVYTGDCNGFAQLGCNDDSGAGLLSSVCVTGLTPGQTFYIQLASFDEDSRGAYNVTITCPCPTGACCVGGVCSVTTEAECNGQSGVYTPGVDCVNHVCPSLANVAPGAGADTCAAPRAIACGQTHTAIPSTEGLAHGTEPDSSCELGGGGPFAQDSDWWYVFTSGPTTTRATVSLCGFTNAAEDTVVTMYTPGSTCAALVELACDDDACTAPNLGPSQFTVTVVPNTQYLIRVEHYSPASAAGTQYTIGIACH